MGWLAVVAIFKTLAFNQCNAEMPNMAQGCVEVVIECTMDEGFENFDFCSSKDYLSWNIEEIKEYQHEFNTGVL